jgi:hypothetical protein
MKKRYIIPFVVIAALGGAPFVVPLFNPWSRINCKDQEIDWLCYRLRMTRYIYWIPFHGAIEETKLSRELSRPQYPVGTRTKAHDHVHQWDTLSTFSQYSKNALHHVSYAAFQQIQELEQIWDTYQFDPSERQTTALEFSATRDDCGMPIGGYSYRANYLIRLTGEAEITHTYPDDLDPIPINPHKPNKSLLPTDNSPTTSIPELPCRAAAE